MTKSLYVVIAILLVAAVGCKQQADQTAANELTPQPVATSPADATLAESTMSTTLVVSINGEVLTRADVEALAHRKLAALQNQRGPVPPSQVPMLMQRMRTDAVQDFIVRRLLMDEAVRLGISVTEQEEAEAYDRIRQGLPEGVTLEDVVKDSPTAEDAMHEEVTVGLTITKLLQEKFTNEVSVTDADIAAYTEENRDQLMLPETVKVRHILIKVPQDADDETVAELQARAEEVRQMIVDGTDFAQVAEKHSEAPSAVRGGELPEFPRGRMLPAFEDAAFSQAVGDVGPLVRTRDGFHIIEVLEHQQPHLMSQEQIASRLRYDLRRQRVGEYIATLRESADIQYGPGVSPSSAAAPPAPGP